MPNFDYAVLDEIVDSYRSRMEEVRKDEVYKWEATYCFRNHWNPDAPDFPQMLEASLSKADNLLIGSMYYPKGMLTIFAKRNQAKVKGMMLSLFDEGKPLKQRLETFSAGASELLEEENRARTESGETPAKNHYQDPRAMSVYLAFANPSSNYLYKAEMYRGFAKLLGLDVPGN